MDSKRPWQIYVLWFGYLLGIAYIANFMFYGMDQKRSFLYYFILGIIMLIFLAQMVALVIRRKWAYYMSLALLIPIGISFVINMILIIFMPSLWLYIIPLSALMTLYSLLCSATRTYFGVK